jgi:hypothetical protein
VDTIFTHDYLPRLLSAIARKFDPEYEPLSRISNFTSEKRATQYEEPMGDMCFMARDKSDNTFGSMPKYDDYGDESDSFSHDNEFYDR